MKIPPVVALKSAVKKEGPGQKTRPVSKPYPMKNQN